MIHDPEIILSITVTKAFFLKFKIYFSTYKIQPDKSKPYTFSSKTPEQLAILYKILSDNNELPESHKSLMDEIVKEACEPPPYPGEKTKFTLSKGWSHWDKPDGDDPIQRRMMFVPTNPESPIKRFWVLGLFNGEISLRIDPTWLSDRKWQKYLKYHGIDLDTFIESFSITDAEEQKQFFTLLVQNNSFEVKDLVKIKQIIEKGSIPTTEELFGCSTCNLGGIVN